MTTDPQIPYGYKRTTGQLQKGDAVYDYASGKFAKVRKDYPYVGLKQLFAIRRCEVVQTELPVIEQPEPIATVAAVIATVEPLNLDE